MITPPEPLHAHTTALIFALQRIAENQPIAEELSTAVFAEMIAGTAPSEQVSEFLLGLRARGESAEEIAGAVKAFRLAMLSLPHPAPHRLVDTCGTGGGSITTINVSTAAAFVAAGAGVPIAKHGNRSHTSRSGSADVLEALGVPIDLTASAAESMLRHHDIAFLFAPAYHPAMRNLADVRRKIGVRTIANLVGPLVNPAAVLRQVLGVGDAHLGPIMAQALSRLGTIHALVIHADVGMDEISPSGCTTVWEVQGATIREWRFDAAESELGTENLDGMEGGAPAENARRIEALFTDPDAAPKALRSAVLLNAAAAIHVGGLAPSLHEGILIAITSLHGGAALAKLQLLRGQLPS